MAEEIPRVVIPENEGAFKFVQLYINNEPCIRFSSSSLGHPKILGDMLNEFNLNFAGLRGENYEVVGMGRACRTCRRFIIEKYGSLTYHIGPNKEHFEKIKSFFPKNLEVVLK